MTDTLPQPFAALEPFARAWALPTEGERVQRRLSSSMEEIRSFYDAMLPRIEDILSYLNRFPLGEMPPDAARLMNLSLSLAEISLAVEWWGEPGVPDGYDPARWKAMHAVKSGFVHSEVAP